MRYEGKSEAEAVEAAASERGVAAGELRYKIVRDEKSFWGGRVVEIEVEGESPSPSAESVRRRGPRLGRRPGKRTGSGCGAAAAG